jgi:hypothetical protein
MSSCRYKYYFGIPNEGFHKHYFGFAIADLIITMIVSFIIMIYIKHKFTTISHSLLFGIVLLIFLLLGEYLHKTVCLT